MKNIKLSHVCFFILTTLFALNMQIHAEEFLLPMEIKNVSASGSTTDTETLNTEISDNDTTPMPTLTPTMTPTPTPTPTPILPKQIAIEALVVEVGENFNKEVGFRYGYIRDDSRHPDSNLKGTDLNFSSDSDSAVYVPRFDIKSDSNYSVGLTDSEKATPGLDVTLTGMSVGDGNIKAAMKAFIQNGDAEIKSQPIAITLEGTETTISTVDEIPFQDVKFTGSKLSPILDVSFEQVGITLKVTPTIEGDKKDKVRLKIANLEVSQVSKYVKSKDITRPVVARANANTEVTLRDKETLVLGGLKSERETENSEFLPYIGRIPLLGMFFKHKNEVMEKTDIYFFITPTIIPTGENPAFPKDFIHQDEVGVEMEK